jgi:hypothetical protein
MIVKKRLFEWSFGFFLFCGGLLLLATLYTAYAHVYLLPPRLAEDLGQLTPRQLDIYQWLWEQARIAAKWAVREGILNPEVREFAKLGVPAYYLNLIAGLASAVLAVSLGGMALLSRNRAQAGRSSDDASPSQHLWNANKEKKSGMLAKDPSDSSSRYEQYNQPTFDKEQAWRFGCTAPPTEQNYPTKAEKSIALRDKPKASERSERRTAGSLGSMQASLDASQHCISEAETALERLQRSTLNLALTHPSLEAVDDVTEVQLAMASLDRLLRNLKSSQAELSEQLTQLNADHYTSRGARFS